MSRVWIVSGFVLIGTGFGLAGFGYFLAGNPNCDAGDLGRACVSASLGAAVIGAALTLGGWMRIKRLGRQDEGVAREGAGVQPLVIMIAVALVGIIVLSVAPPYAALPVDVYARPQPAPGADPSQFLVDDLGGRARLSLVNFTDAPNGSFVASADYGNGQRVQIAAFAVNNSSSLAAATARAAAFIDREYSSHATGSAAHACAKPGEKQWYIIDGGDVGWLLSWRRANFVVTVVAPNGPARDMMAGALSI